MDDDDLEGEDGSFPSYPWTKEHAYTDIMSFMADLQEATASFLRTVAARAAADSNNKVDERLFLEEAAKQIETIITEGD